MSDNKANIETVLISMSDLVSNTGQVTDIPRNPRIIRDKNFKKLVKSIEDDPEMMNLNNLWVYPYKKKFIVMVGNQRLAALKDLNWESAPCKIIPKDTDKKKIRGWIIKENRHAGEDDMEALINWDIEELADFGVELLGSSGDPFDDKGIEANDQYGVIVMCKDAKEQEKIYSRLTDEGLTCKVVVT